MNGCGAAGGDGQAAVVGCNLHPVLFGHGFRIVAGLFDVVKNQIQTFQSIEIAERIGLVAGEALDAVSQRIHTSGCRDLSGKIFDHSCIQNDVIGDHVVVYDADLQLFFRNGYDGIGRYLSAGAGSGGDQDDGNAFFCTARLIQKLLHAVFVGNQDAGQLGRVHNAAAAAGNDHVGSAFLKLIHQFLNSHVASLCGKLIQNIVVGSGCLYGLLRQGEQACAFDSLVGEHGNPFYVVGL